MEGLIHISSPQFLPGNQILTSEAFELLEEDSVLLNQSGAATWSTNSTSKVQNSATGKLLDCGYLVVTNTLELSNVIPKWNGPLFTMKMIFTSVPEIPLNRYVKNITFVYNENESNCTYASTLPNAFTRRVKLFVLTYKNSNKNSQELGIGRSWRWVCEESLYNVMVEERRFPKNSQSLAAKTDEECELACLSNCACNASAFDNRAMAKRKTTLIVATVISRFFALLAIVLVILRRRRSAGLFETVKLRSATEKFLENLADGAFGYAFKGTFPNSTAIAIKVKTIGMILLINLVHLMGTCVEASKRFLVYENMPNGSLESLNGRDFSRVRTTMRGTRGYLAPERISGEAVTPKADVLCYGMLLLEEEEDFQDYFPLQAANTVYQGENAIALLDALIEELIRARKFKIIRRIGQRCLFSFQLVFVVRASAYVTSCCTMIENAGLICAAAFKKEVVAR
ncbi:hypothetical protein CUMW_176870 [Citrus unshiu]|uniref:Apple domain-containing protein n=1 Tax=Citrus unshiu TaxID=55188 RepID=A0A2H5PXK1_CITUN|nr:hypothetical protein CUMW_176870 [Citrus unshiu]